MMRKGLWVMGLWFGCATSEPATKQGTVSSGTSEQATPESGITQEQNDAIEALFRRKAHELQSCWTDEYDKTKNRKFEIDITVGLTVTPSGKPRDVRVLKSSVPSA